MARMQMDNPNASELRYIEKDAKDADHRTTKRKEQKKKSKVYTSIALNSRDLVGIMDLDAELPHLVNRQSIARVRIVGLAQHDQIGISASLQGSLDTLQAQQARGGGSDRINGIRGGSIRPATEVVDTLDERGGTSSNLIRALQGQAGAGLDDALAVGPLVDTVRQSTQAHRIGDQNETIRVGIVGDLDGGRVQMDAIGNHAVVRATTLTLTQQTEDARVTVVEGTHGVKQVSDHACALVGRRDGLLVGGVRMADGVDDAPLNDFGDLGHHVANLWGRSDHFDGACGSHVIGAIDGEQVLKCLCRLQYLALVDAVAAGVDEWTLGVSTEDLGAVFWEVIGTLGTERWKNLFMFFVSLFFIRFDSVVKVYICIPCGRLQQWS